MDEESEKMLKRAEALFDKMDAHGLDSRVLPMSEKEKAALTRAPVIAVRNVNESSLDVIFWKMYGTSPWWGVLVTDHQRRINLTKVSIEDLDRLIFQVRLEKFRAMTDQPKRLTVVAGTVSESENGPFMSNGEISFEKIHEGWHVLLGKDLELEFHLPEGEEYAQQMLHAYERKYNQFCAWMVKQLT
jgi:hypothetical protein